MFGVINSETKSAWQGIADTVSRQRPSVGRRALVVGGRKLKGEPVTILRHQLDKYVDVFRYGNEASHHVRAMSGRRGFMCLVRTDAGVEKWVKANYLACDYDYAHWSVALFDALLAGVA
jgi:hypothetical protein